MAGSLSSDADKVTRFIRRNADIFIVTGLLLFLVFVSGLRQYNAPEPNATANTTDSGSHPSGGTLTLNANIQFAGARPSSPSAGTLYYNSSAGYNTLQIYDGTVWRNITMSGAA